MALSFCAVTTKLSPHSDIGRALANPQRASERSPNPLLMEKVTVRASKQSERQMGALTESLNPIVVPPSLEEGGMLRRKIGGKELEIGVQKIRTSSKMRRNTKTKVLGSKWIYFASNSEANPKKPNRDHATESLGSVSVPRRARGEQQKGAVGRFRKQRNTSSRLEPDKAAKRRAALHFLQRK